LNDWQLILNNIYISYVIQINMSLIKIIVNFFIEGTRPIRAVEGFALIVSMLTLSYFIYFFELKGFILFLVPLLGLISFLGYVHIKGCRGFYEMFVYDLEVLKNEQSNFHRFMISLIKVFEYYLIFFTIFSLIVFLNGFLNFVEPVFLKMIIGISAIAYTIIASTGHTTRFLVIREIKNIKKGKAIEIDSL